MDDSRGGANATRESFDAGRRGARQVTDTEERDRGKQYLDECVDSENQVGNATKLDERAELARRSTMDDNRGSANATRESFVGPRNTLLATHKSAFCCWTSVMQGGQSASQQLFGA